MTSQPAPASPPAPCNADAASFAIGQPMDPVLQEQVRARTGAVRVRVVAPGQMVTMDYDEHRLTIDVDAQGRVTRARCG